MHRQAFIIANGWAAVVANDVNDLRYLSTMRYLAPGAAMPLRSHSGAETQFMIVEGMLEFMVGGGTSCLGANDFVRVAPGMAYAYRNLSDRSPARLLVRTVHPLPQPRRLTTRIEYVA